MYKERKFKFSIIHKNIYYLTNIMRQYNRNRFVIEVDLIHDHVGTCPLNDPRFYTLDKMPWFLGISLVHLGANTS